MANVLPDEQAFLDVRDEEVEGWLVAAKAGGANERENLYCWVYVTARQYYTSKSRVEKALSADDAEELAGQFFLEFERTWPRLQSATRFTRYLLPNILRRYLKRKRKVLRRQTPLPAHEPDPATGYASTGHIERPWERWSDHDWYQYQATLYVLKEADEQTRAIIAYRIESPPLTYREIAQQINMSETAVRMRASRFYAAVRLCYRERFVRT